MAKFFASSRTVWVGIAALAAIALFLLTTSARERGLALNTLYLVAGVWTISLPIGVLLALLLARCDVAGRKLLTVLLVVTLFLPLYVQNAAWQAGFGQQGWWELLFSRLGARPPLDHWRGAIWIHAMAAVPWVVLIVGAALRQVDPELEEAALVDGPPGKVLWYVTLRRSLAAIVAAGLWVGVAASGEITVTDMWQLRTYAEEVYIGFALGDTIEQVTLHVLPAILLVASFSLAALVALAQLVPRDTRPRPRPPLTFCLGAWRWPLTLVAFLLVAMLLGAPLGNLILKLGIVVEQSGAERTRLWSLAEAGRVLLRSPWEFRREVIWSLITGSTAATCAIAITTPLAWLACSGGLRAWGVKLAIAILVAIPGPIMGLALIEAFNQPGRPWLNYLYDRSITVVVIALVARALPLALLVLWYALASVPQATLEIAALEGAGFWRRLWRIALPQRKLAIVAAWLVALAVAIGDLSASFLVLPPGLSLLSRRIFEEAHYGVDNRLAGLTLTAIAVVALIGAAAMAFLHRQTSIVAGEANKL